MGYREKYFRNNRSLFGKYRCNCCGKWFSKSEIDVDHIIPKSKGGGDDVWNLQALCKHCNRSKQDKMTNVPKDLLKNVARNVVRTGIRKLTGKG